MRVEIRHRQEAHVAAHYGIVVSIFLSEQDRRVINANGLIGSRLDVSPGVINYFPLPTWAPKLCFALTPFLFLSGCFFGCVAVINQSESSPGKFTWFLALCALAFGIFSKIMLARQRSTFTLRELYESPHIKITVPNPMDATVANNAIKQSLYRLRQNLEEIAALTFEIIEI